MKKYIFYTLTFVSIIILSYFCKLHFEEKNSLTKSEIWSIIDNIDETLLGSISKTGERELYDSSKMDFMIKYLITNREKYKDAIKTSQSVLEKDGTIYYNFGKVESQYMYNKIKEIFTSFNYDMESTEIYNNGYIELFYEPTEHISCDCKNIIDLKKKKGYIYMYIEYIRSIGEQTNKFIVEYVVDKYTYKIASVKICDSYMN